MYEAARIVKFMESNGGSQELGEGGMRSYSDYSDEQYVLNPTELNT